MQIQTYLALEIGLTRRLQKAWARESKPAYEAIANAVNDEDWHTATALVHKLDMTHVGEENKEWIKHYLLSCAVYGAKRANKKGPQFVGAGNHQARIDQVTQTICTYFEHRGTALVQAKALQLIAKAENAAKAKALASVQKGAPLGNQNAAGPHTTQATISVEHVNDTRITLVAQDKYVCNGVRTDFDINVGKLTLSKSTGTWQVTDMSVSDTHRGQGLNTSMLEKAVHEVGPFNTTGVFSPQGKAQMGSLVRRGLADDVGNGDYLIHFKQPTTKADEQPLYVSRPLTNPDPLIAWAKKVGFETTCLPEDLHVTVVYSKAAMDWTALAPDTDPIEVAANGRGLELFGEACVLTLTSPELQKRFQEFRDSGASFDYDKYTPHVTITYNVPPEFDIEKVKPFMGTLVLGPEVYEAINSDKDFAEKGDVDGHEFHGNQWTGGEGGGASPWQGKLQVDLPPEVHAQVTHALNDVAKLFPSVAGIGVKDGDWLRGSDTLATKSNNDLYLNTDLWTKPGFFAQYQKDWDGCVVDPSPYGVVVHELGHILAGQALAGLGPRAYNKVLKSAFGDINAISNSETTPYGMENVHEAVAEDFAQVVYGKPQGNNDLYQKSYDTSVNLWKSLVKGIK